MEEKFDQLYFAPIEFLSLVLFATCPKIWKKESNMVDDLNPAENGEACEETHVATDERDEGGEGDLDILLHDVVSWGSNVEMDNLQWLEIFVPSCETTQQSSTQDKTGVSNEILECFKGKNS